MNFLKWLFDDVSMKGSSLGIGWQRADEGRCYTYQEELQIGEGYSLMYGPIIPEWMWEKTLENPNTVIANTAYLNYISDVKDTQCE